MELRQLPKEIQEKRKLAYLFNINKKEMSKYSKTFLSSEIVKLLDKLINEI